ncbi:MAG: GNAT family N-acetyltransferase [Flavipsychrobacter sp.]
MALFTAKDGKQIEIRPARRQDAAAIIAFAKVLFQSTDQVLTLPEEYTISVQDEELFIDSHTTDRNALLLVAVYNDAVVALLNFKCYPKKKIQHSGEFGVSVHPAFQGLGIGRRIIETFLAWAKQSAQVEKVILNVFHTNATAMQLYKNLGFVEEGRMQKAAKQQDGSYVDIISMAIFTL